MRQKRSKVSSPTSALVPAFVPDTPRELRVRAGLTLIQTAVLADVAEATIRIFEASRDGVGPKSRAKLDLFYARLSRTAPPPRPEAAPLPSGPER